MTQYEIECLYSFIHKAREIRKQLRIANKLKVLELKLNHLEATNMIDDIESEIV